MPPLVEVVLVRPETPANVGAVARVIRNTGLQSLTLVAPEDWKTVEAWRTAWRAQEVLEHAKVVPDLASALAGSTRTVALSRHRGVLSRDVREEAAAIAALGTDERVCLVFGPETSGLTHRELALCGRQAYVPAHPSQPSLNLSHAVMVTGYEVFRAARRPDQEARRATHAEKQIMLERLRQGLEAIRALPVRRTDTFFEQWRALFQRADLTPKEVRLLEHMARKMSRCGQS